MPRLERDDGAPPLGRYTLTDRMLGSGSQGEILVALDGSTGEHVAAKLFESEDVARKEAALHMRCSGHPHVARVREFIPARHDGAAHRAVLILELLPGGDLFDHVIAAGALGEPEARALFAELVEAVAHCHAQGVAHRDLKLENVLLDADRHVKLADFGLAGAFRLHKDAPERLLVDRCGSRAYIAPELLAAPAQPYAGRAADVWSLGVCLFTMATGFFAFELADESTDSRVQAARRAQTHGASTVRALYAEARMGCTLSVPLQQLLDTMLLLEPSRRATLAEVQASAWMRAGKADAPAAVPVGAAAHADPLAAPPASPPAASPALPDPPALAAVGAVGAVGAGSVRRRLSLSSTGDGGSAHGALEAKRRRLSARDDAGLLAPRSRRSGPSGPGARGPCRDGCGDGCREGENDAQAPRALVVPAAASVWGAQPLPLALPRPLPPVDFAATLAAAAATAAAAAVAFGEEVSTPPVKPRLTASVVPPAALPPSFELGALPGADGALRRAAAGGGAVSPQPGAAPCETPAKQVRRQSTGRARRALELYGQLRLDVPPTPATAPRADMTMRPWP